MQIENDPNILYAALHDEQNHGTAFNGTRFVFSSIRFDGRAGKKKRKQMVSGFMR